jgi:hypothetical protein
MIPTKAICHHPGVKFTGMEMRAAYFVLHLALVVEWSSQGRSEAAKLVRSQCTAP